MPSKLTKLSISCALLLLPPPVANAEVGPKAKGRLCNIGYIDSLHSGIKGGYTMIHIDATGFPPEDGDTRKVEWHNRWWINMYPGPVEDYKDKIALLRMAMQNRLPVRIWGAEYCNNVSDYFEVTVCTSEGACKL